MSKDSRDYLDIAYRSIKCFSNDGKLLLPELNDLVAIAERDGVVDDNERRVLGSIVNRLKDHELSLPMKKRIDALKKQHSL